MPYSEYFDHATLCANVTNRADFIRGIIRRLSLFLPEVIIGHQPVPCRPADVLSPAALPDAGPRRKVVLLQGKLSPRLDAEDGRCLCAGIHHLEHGYSRPLHRPGLWLLVQQKRPSGTKIDLRNTCVSYSDCGDTCGPVLRVGY